MMEISINRNAPTQDKIITNRTLHRFCDLKKADLDLVFGDLVSQVRIVELNTPNHKDMAKIQEKIKK